MNLFKSAVLFCSSVALAHGSVLGVAGDYNVFTFGDFSGNSDSQGRVAVGGNATLTNFGIGSSLGAASATDPYTLVVGGNLTYQNGQTNYGGVAVGGTAGLTNIGVNGNVNVDGALTTQNGQINGKVSAASWSSQSTGGPSGTTGTAAPISSIVDFAGIQTALDNNSMSWGALTSTGSITSSYGSLTLTGSSSGFNVFDLTSAQLAGATGGVTISAPAGSTVLVNVSGTAASFPNTGYNLNGISSQNVIFNFDNATTLSGSGGFNGSILAPYANFTFNNGQINGNVIVESMSGSGETHDVSFDGSLPGASPVPEPSSFLLLSTGFGMMLVGTVFLRRQRARIKG